MMRRAEWINVVYFFGLISLSFMRRLSLRSRVKIAGIGIVGVGITAATVLAAPSVIFSALQIVRDWLPVPLMVLAYRQSGYFFQKPDRKIQATFENWDRKLFQFLRPLGTIIRITPLVAEYCELAYLLCYPIVPLGLAVLYATHLRGHTDDYWVVVLLSAYSCYALLPFVQTLPPRLIEPREKAVYAASWVRRLNLWITRHAAHGANTFPSGHVAASMAIALALLRLTPVSGIVFLFAAISIALGCVIGRYHYAIDVVAAALLAAVVFSAIAYFDMQ